MSAPDHRPLNDRSVGPIEWMARNPVVANLIMLAFIVGGLIAATRIKQEVFPDFELELIEVRVSYPGASPEEIESGILQAVEDAVRGVDQINDVYAVAREGVGSVTGEYDSGTDSMKIYQEVQQAIDRIRTLPEDAENPEVKIFNRSRDVLELIIYGDTDEWTLRNIAEDVRNQLRAYPNITEIEVEDSVGYELHISPRREVLRAYGLSLGDLARRISNASVQLPGGGIRTTQGEVLVRFDERRDYASEFARIPIITTSEGAALTLGEIADVSEGFAEIETVTSYQGVPSVNLEIFRVGDQKPSEISRDVKEALKLIEPSLPAGVHVLVEDDKSVMFDQRLTLLLKNAGLGLLLVLVLLGLFLELRLAFWVTVGIPVAFLGTLIFLPSMDVSLNMISMFAFIIALGIVVDDAIVVGEGIYAHREEGLSPTDAAIKGAKEMASPVGFSVMSNIVAFLPLLFIPGWMGKVWLAIPLVVAGVFVMSWIESVLILPSHIAALRAESSIRFIRWADRHQQQISRGLQRGINRFYSPFLLACLRRRYLVMASGVSVLILVVAYAASGRLGWTLMPNVEADEAYGTAGAPAGTPLEQLIRIRDEMEASARKVIEENGGTELATGIFSGINGNRISTRVYLTEPEKRPISTSGFAKLWREASGKISGTDWLRFEADRGGPGSGAALTVELSHPQINTLEKAGQALGKQLAMIDGVSDVDDGFNLGKEQLTFKMTTYGRSLGLTTSDVARQVRHSFYGAEAVRQMRGQHEIKVLVRLADDQRRSEFDLEQLMITTPSGKDVPLRQIASVERGRAFNSIQRRNGNRTMTVSAQVTPEENTNLVTNTLVREILPALQIDYPGLAYSFEGKQKQMRESFGALGTGFIFVLVIIYFLLAIPFRSYIQPFIVMFAIPFGIVGAVLGHSLMGFSLSVISLMGIIALAGVVVNDSLVMVVYANQKRSEGQSPFNAMLAAGVRRFRPIILTTLTTFCGLAPMIFETSRQAQFMVPMAISLGYGLLFATAITLIIVPALYVIVDDIALIFRGKIRPASEAEEAEAPVL